MKRALLITVLFSILSGILACESLQVTGDNDFIFEGDYVKTIEVRFDDSITKADDTVIDDATLFVYQITDGGSPILYKRLYTTYVSDISVDFLFNSQIEYTYVISAYGNMGELESEPEDVLFSGESLGAFQCHGKSAELNADDTVISIGMKRYVNKVSVSSIRLALPDAYDSSPVILKAAWLAQVPDAVGGNILLNADGTYTATEYSGLLYRSMNVNLVNGTSNSIDLEVYCYGESFKLVLECETLGNIRYYSVDVSGLSANNHVDYALSIYQEGASEPLGTLPEMAIVANTTAVSMDDFDAFNISVTGNTSGLVFTTVRNGDGSITVTAHPEVPGTQVNKVSVVGDVSSVELVDNDTFSRSLTLSDFQGDVVLEYTGVTNYNYLTCEYEVTDCTQPVMLLYETASTPFGKFRSSFVKFIVDGTEVEPSATYTFDSNGVHVVSFLTDNGITSLNGMFNKCVALLNVKGSNSQFTKNVSSILGTFQHCTGLRYIDGLKDWDVSNVTTLRGLFNGCSNLQSVVPLQNWDISGVNNLNIFLQNCASVDSIDSLSEWDTGSVTDMSHCFNGTSVKDISCLSSWDVKNVTNMSGMFSECPITSVSSLSSWDTGNVVYMSGLFNMTSVNSLTGLENWDTHKVQDFSYTFCGCKFSDTEPLKNWDTSSCLTMAAMFSENPYLSDLLGIASWNIGNVTDLSHLFAFNFTTTQLEDKVLINGLLDISPLQSWNTGSCKNFLCMFGGQHKLEHASCLSDWDMSSATSTKAMFAKCNSLLDLSIVNWDLSSLTDCSVMFSGITTTGVLYHSNGINHGMVTSVIPASWVTVTP